MPLLKVFYQLCDPLFVIWTTHTHNIKIFRPSLTFFHKDPRSRNGGTRLPLYPANKSGDSAGLKSGTDLYILRICQNLANEGSYLIVTNKLCTDIQTKKTTAYILMLAMNLLPGMFHHVVYPWRELPAYFLIKGTKQWNDFEDVKRKFSIKIQVFECIHEKVNEGL